MTDTVTDSDTDTDTVATVATLCRILAEVLEVDLVHPQDGFFEVGGDSVLAVAVVARAREAGLVMSVRDLFDHQTAETLAEVIDAHPRQDNGSGNAAATGKAPLLPFADGEFGEFEEFGAAGSGAEAEWETIT